MPVAFFVRRELSVSAMTRAPVALGPAAASVARHEHRDERQQILGNCSPESMATTRSPPISDRSVTIPGCSDTTSPMIAAFRPSGWARMTCNEPVGLLRRNDGDQLSFIGDVKRVEPQHLAGGRGPRARTGNARPR